jgi:Tol biopolymer transport system component
MTFVWNLRLAAAGALAFALVTASVGCGQSKRKAEASSRKTTDTTLRPLGTISVVSADRRTIFLIAPATGRTTRVRAPALILDMRADLSNDGHRIATAASNAIWVFDRSGANARRVVRVPEGGPDLADASWSPGGQRLVFARNDSFFTVDVRGKNVKRLVAGPAHAPDWSPTGSAIVFVGVAGRRADVISSIKTDGSHLRRVLQGGDPDVSPDGKKLAFARRGGIYVVPIAGGTPERVISYARHPEWSPDGAYLAFTQTGRRCNEAGCSGRVLIVRATGGRARAIGPTIFNIGPLSWSR